LVCPRGSGWRIPRASLGRPTLNPDLRYWPVPPLGVIYRVHGDEMIVVAVVDPRRLGRLP
jgi:hypothetical protein